MLVGPHATKRTSREATRRAYLWIQLYVLPQSWRHVAAIEDPCSISQL